MRRRQAGELAFHTWDVCPRKAYRKESFDRREMSVRREAGWSKRREVSRSTGRQGGTVPGDRNEGNPLLGRGTISETSPTSIEKKKRQNRKNLQVGKNDQSKQRKSLEDEGRKKRKTPAADQIVL